MKSFYRSLLLSVWSLSMLFGLASAASAVNCSSATAKWNRDYYADPSGKTFISSPFQCEVYSGGSGYSKNSPTIIKSNEAECPVGQRCIRTQDCNDIGGICFSGSVTMANIKYPDGEPRSKYPDYTASIPFRCPGDASISCFVPKVSSLSAEPITTPESLAAEPSVPEAPQVPTPFTNCCREIVPKDGNSYSEGKYGLNHFIQVGINIYECILCMVAALMLLMFVIGSFYLMTSAGSKPSVDKGIAIIKNAIIGAIIVFASILIVNYSVKALGGSFLDTQKLQVNPAAGKQITSVAGAPAPVIAIPAPPAPIPTTSTTISGISFDYSCTQDQIDAIEAALKYLEGKITPSFGDMAVYTKSVFTEYICYGSGYSLGGAMAAYRPEKYDSTGKPLDCPDYVHVWQSTFDEEIMKRSSILVHEAAHAHDCKDGTLNIKKNCVAEQKAHSVQADYLEILGDAKQAGTTRCLWWKKYPGCTKATDPRC